MGLDFSIDGECIVAIGLPKELHNRYTGSYSITPTKASQTVECEELIMSDDLTVGAIPDKYIDINDWVGTDTAGALTLDTATEIKTYRLYKNPKLSSLTAPEVLSIGNYGVAECPNLGSVILAKCTTLSQYAFYGCTGLTSFSAPALTRVGFAALRGCTALTSFSDFEALTYIGESAFNSCTALAFTDDTLNLTSPEIYANAFYGNGNIKTVDFSGTPKLNANAFYNCPNLKTVYFHQTANSIAATAFNGCTGITDIYVPWSSSDTINANAPFGAVNATIHYNTTYPIS